MKITKELKVAIVAIAGIVIFILGYSFLKNNSILSGSKKIYSYFNDVEGLGVGADVNINGFSVGSVSDIDFSEDFSALKVEMNIRSDLKISKNSSAVLYETSLIGGRAIQILPIYDSEVIKSGDELPSVVKPVLTSMLNDQFAPLRTKLENLITSLDTLVIGFNQVFDDDGQIKLKGALEDFTLLVENINQLSSEIVKGVEKNRGSFDQTLSNVVSASENIKSLSDSLIRLDLNKTVVDFNHLIVQINSAMGLITSNQGTIGQLINDPTLYNNLTKTTADLNSLMLDLQSNPKRYVHFSLFGRKDKTTPKKEN